MLTQRYKPDLPKLLQKLEPFVDAGPYEELKRIVGEIESKVRRMP